jgi:predicted phosphohydrolase
VAIKGYNVSIFVLMEKVFYINIKITISINSLALLYAIMQKNERDFLTMSLFVIGDLHLSFGTDKPMDIFSGWDNYIQKLEYNWDYLVEENDTVVIVGDISWGMTMEDARADFEFINNLKGKKIILKGNHDYWFSTKSKVDQFLKQNKFDSIKILFNNAYEYGDYAICGTRGWINEKGQQADKKVLNREAGRLEISIQAGLKTKKTPLVFLHYPPIYANDECIEILDVLHKYKIKKVYYGHIHGTACKYAINGERDGIEYMLTSCDYTQFNPVKIL